MGAVPDEVRSLFWEGLAEEPDDERHADYVAIRVLERGDEAAFRWLIARYGRESVRRVAESGRLTPHQARFWQRVLADA